MSAFAELGKLVLIENEELKKENEKLLVLLGEGYQWIKDQYVPDIDIDNGSYLEWLNRYEEMRGGK